MISFIKKFVLDILTFDSINSQFSDKKKADSKEQFYVSTNNIFIHHLSQDEITIN